jgi:hypothetical protein
MRYTDTASLPTDTNTTPARPSKQSIFETPTKGYCQPILLQNFHHLRIENEKKKITAALSMLGFHVGE